jgi:hypothetical protein
VVQLSLFSADVDEPTSADLAGLLAAHGQAQHTDTGTRISIAVAEPWRAQAIVRELLSTGLPAEISASCEGRPVARTLPGHDLDDLAAHWLSGAVKAVPAGWVPSPRALRLWVLAAGRPEGDRYLLGLDPYAPECHAPLATALMRVGIAPTLVGTRDTTPALRVAGHRRLLRLLEYVGRPPAIAGAAVAWPRESPDLHGLDAHG